MLEQSVLDQARIDLAQQLGIRVDEVEVIGVLRMFKPTGVTDTPGQAAGWLIRLAVGDTVYRYQVDLRGNIRQDRPAGKT